jgi:hypothetical protein
VTSKTNAKQKQKQKQNIVTSKAEWHPKQPQNKRLKTRMGNLAKLLQ